MSLDTVFRKNGWTIDLRGTLFGRSSAFLDGGNTSNYVENFIDETVIADLNVGYAITRRIGVSVGADNPRNTYPTKVNSTTYAVGLATGGNGVATYNSWSPFGINGGCYYGRLTIGF